MTPVFAVCAAALFAVGACAQSDPAAVKLWAQQDRFGAPPPMARRGAEDVFYDSATRTVHLHGAINEVLAFKLSVEAEGRVDVTVDAFTDPAGRRLEGNVTLYRVQFVQVRDWPGWHLKRIEPRRRQNLIGDVLVPVSAPIGGLPVTVGADELLDLWADVRIPKGTTPGQYATKMHVTVGEVEAGAVNVVLTVWPFVLPDAAAPELLIDVDQQALFAHHVAMNDAPYAPPRILADDPRRDELQAVLTSAMRLLYDHGLAPQLPHLYPLVRMGADQHAAVDWSDYARTIAPYVDGTAYAERMPARSWPIPFDETFPSPPAYGAMRSPTYAKLLHEYLASAAEFFAEKGWLPRAYVRIPYASQPGATSCAATRHFGYIVHYADPRLRTLSPLFPQDMTGWGWYGFTPEDLRDEVDIWAPPAQFFDGRALAADYGAVRHLTIDRPPFSGSTGVFAPAIDTRVLAWQTRAANVEALHLGAANDWPSATADATRPQACVDHDARVLIYPGKPFGLAEPVPSVRLKRLRRGVQDAAYLALLASRGKEHIASTIERSLLAYFGAAAYGAHCADGRRGGWVEEPERWETARRIMADELLATIAGRDRPRFELMPATIRWRRFMEATRTVDMEVSGVRIRFAEVRPEEGVEIECAVNVTNRLRVPLLGALRFDRLPLGWSGAPGERRLQRLAPGESASLVLVARAPSLTWGEDGVLYLPLVFAREDGGTGRLSARLCHVVAQRLDAPLVLDGDLRDWPTGVGNYAGDFILLTGEGGAGGDVPTGRPTHRTLCFVGRAHDRLYFGVRCGYDPAKGVGPVQSSAVVPDDLVTHGEDTIEILLDPANAGGRSPADLYRIVVRGSGAVWEHGVTTNPPTGPPQVWAAAIRHAIRRDGDSWTAELEVPLDAFPEIYRSGAVWGLNVVRFDWGDQEASNWAGAVGNVYDPLALGNMTVP